MEKISKRVNAIEEVNNNVKLLTEMVTSYTKGETTESNEDLMKVRRGWCQESFLLFPSQPGLQCPPACGRVVLAFRLPHHLPSTSYCCLPQPPFFPTGAVSAL